MNGNDCCICFSNLDKIFTITTSCKHTYCLNCFLNLNMFKCPICRYNFEIDLPEKIKLIIINNLKTKNESNSSNNLFNFNFTDFPPLSQKQKYKFEFINNSIC